MDPLAHHFATMAHNNGWANERLLSAVCRLSEDEFVAPRTGFFPSICATLNHNLTVDWFYVDALERGFRNEPVNPEARRFFDREEPMGSARELHDAQRAVDARLVSLARTLSVELLATPIAVAFRSGVKNERADRLLSHLFQHQIHHRGQAHAMLAGTSIAPPQLDEFFCASEAALRAPEFAALGWTEEWIWKA